jgi:hypothetical protein
MGEKWIRQAIFKLFNDSYTARRAGLSLSTGSLSGKRWDAIIAELAVLILKANLRLSIDP